MASVEGTRGHGGDCGRLGRPPSLTRTAAPQGQLILPWQCGLGASGKPQTYHLVAFLLWS